MRHGTTERENRRRHRRGVRHRRSHRATVRGGGGEGGVCRPRRRSGQARRGGDRGKRRPGAVRGSARGARGRGRSLRQASRGSLGRLDVLVNNAGIRLYHTVDEASSESWDEILGVNLKGYAFCAKAAIPLIRQGGGGSIVNVASVRSVTSVGKTTQYDTTKAAVAGLTRGMAADHAPDQIRVNAVCPGPIFTPSHERRTRELGRTLEQYREDAAKGTMLRRHGTPEEVAACILFLASDDASYVTGTLLFVDGGYTAM